MAGIFTEKMKARSRIRKTAIVLAVAISAQVLGNALLSREMKSISSPGANWSLVLSHGMEDPKVWIATGLLAVFFFLYASALSWADLSFVLPATSFGYVLNVAAAHFVLDEPVSPGKWIATAMICVGVAVIGRSGLQGGLE